MYIIEELQRRIISKKVTKKSQMNTNMASCNVAETIAILLRNERGTIDLSALLQKCTPKIIPLKSKYLEKANSKMLTGLFEESVRRLVQLYSIFT